MGSGAATNTKARRSAEATSATTCSGTETNDGAAMTTYAVSSLSRKEPMIILPSSHAVGLEIAPSAPRSEEVAWSGGWTELARSVPSAL
jgi:hypothetical protein